MDTAYNWDKDLVYNAFHAKAVKERRGEGKEKKCKWQDDFTAYVGTAWLRLVQNRSRWLLNDMGYIQLYMNNQQGKASHASYVVLVHKCYIYERYFSEICKIQRANFVCINISLVLNENLVMAF